MRTFISVEIPENIKGEIVKVQEQIPADIAKLKNVDKEQIHITLKFLGDIEESKTGQIKQELSKMKQKPFKLTTSKIGFFPNEKNIRVIWIGFKDNRDIFELQSKVDNALLGLGFMKDKRFHPHLTIARVKFVKDKQQFVKTLKELKVEEQEFDVASFRLMKSTLTPNGPLYEVLAEFQLG